MDYFDRFNHGIHNQPIMVPAHEYNKLLAMARKLKDCIEDMRNEQKHVTNAYFNYTVNLKPVWEASYENE